MMVRIKELQRRLDQTLGKAANGVPTSEKERQRLTITSRLARVEEKTNRMDLKMDQTIIMLNTILKRLEERDDTLTSTTIQSRRSSSSAVPPFVDDVP